MFKVLFLSVVLLFSMPVMAEESGRPRSSEKSRCTTLKKMSIEMERYNFMMIGSGISLSQVPIPIMMFVNDKGNWILLWVLSEDNVCVIDGGVEFQFHVPPKKEDISERVF